jgi:hypothetical protein
MLKMKAKAQEAPAPYVPTALVRPTLDEIKNGWTAETLTAYLRSSSVNEFSFRQEALVRAKWRQEQAAKAVAEFRKTQALGDPMAAKALARLERELMEASGDAHHAEGLLDVAAEECAA